MQKKKTIAVTFITPEERNNLYNEQEGDFFELKSIDINPGKLTDTLSAFANTNGGELYVGIDEKKTGKIINHKWRGFINPEAANGHIQAIEEFFPIGHYCNYTFLQCMKNKGLILKLEIHRTREVMKASNGIAYLRRGAQNLPQKTYDQLRRLELNKGISSYETETINVEPKTIESSKVLREFLSNVAPSAESHNWLKSQNLINKDKPTIAAAILFAEEPQAIFPKHCGIKILRYRTQDKEGSRPVLAFDPLTIEGHAYKLICDAVSKTIEIIEDIPKLGSLGLLPIQYPRETLHEIITNAVLHRDYSIASDIQIRIFDNRIEIESPGSLPGHITIDNILYEQFARNSHIVRLINKFPNPPNKDVGEGLNTAIDAMTRLKLKAPIIQENESSVTVYIKHESLASPEEAVLQYLATSYTITNRKARILTGIQSENSMKKVFYRLRDSNLIEQVPGKVGASSAWQKKGVIKRLL
jgi:ATP-dependent DNA helicase RecG